MAHVKSGIIGLAVGDALGVPIEFNDRSQLETKPLTDMIGYGTHNQPDGTWSDDTSMTLCTMESIIEKGLDLRNIAKWFIRWRRERIWTPHGKVFDIGTGTQLAIMNMSDGEEPTKCGSDSINNNGNGALMRMLPLIYVLENESSTKNRFKVVTDLTCLTHGHIISRVASFIYVEIGILVLKGYNIKEAYTKVCSKYRNQLYTMLGEHSKEFYRILDGSVGELNKAQISSSGYVIHTLEASLWSLLNSSSYKEAVLMAVNLGEDTDTTGAVTGGLAGIMYGFDSIPIEWVNKLARVDEVIELCSRFEHI